MSLSRLEIRTRGTLNDAKEHAPRRPLFFFHVPCSGLDLSLAASPALMPMQFEQLPHVDLAWFDVSSGKRVTAVLAKMILCSARAQ